MTKTERVVQVFNHIVRRTITIDLAATENSGFFMVPESFVLQEENPQTVSVGTTGIGAVTVNVMSTVGFTATGTAYFADGDDFAYTGITDTSFTGVTGVTNVHAAESVIQQNAVLVATAITGCGTYLELRKVAASLSLYCSSVPDPITILSGLLLGSAHTVAAVASRFTITYDVPVGV